MIAVEFLALAAFVLLVLGGVCSWIGRRRDRRARRPGFVYPVARDGSPVASDDDLVAAIMRAQRERS